MFTKLPPPNAIKDTVNPQIAPGYGWKGSLPSALTSCHLRGTGVRCQAQHFAHILSSKPKDTHGMGVGIILV